MKLGIIKIVVAFSGIISYSDLYSQEMKNNLSKKLTAEEFKVYIQQNHGKLTVLPFLKHCNFYECDSNTLIVENPIEKKYTLYLNRGQYYEKMDKISKQQAGTPLKDKQTIISKIDVNKDQLIDQLFQQIGIDYSSEKENIDLKLIDKKIKEYGYGKAYNDLLLNLIVFAGEYIRTKKGGSWVIERNKSYSSELMPVFVDNEGRKYDFDINIQMQKEFLEQGIISMENIIEMSLLPKFEINSRGRNTK
jgi:hypothetical protein